MRGKESDMGLLFKLLYAAILVCILELRGWVFMAEVGVLRVIAMAGEVATSPKKKKDIQEVALTGYVKDIETAFEHFSSSRF